MIPHWAAARIRPEIHGKGDGWSQDTDAYTILVVTLRSVGHIPYRTVP